VVAATDLEVAGGVVVGGLVPRVSAPASADVSKP
jgi:hypothetical protein